MELLGTKMLVSVTQIQWPVRFDLSWLVLIRPVTPDAPPISIVSKQKNLDFVPSFNHKWPCRSKIRKTKSVVKTNSDEKTYEEKLFVNQPRRRLNHFWHRKCPRSIQWKYRRC